MNTSINKLIANSYKFKIDDFIYFAQNNDTKNIAQLYYNKSDTRSLIYHVLDVAIEKDLYNLYAFMLNLITDEPNHVTYAKSVIIELGVQYGKLFSLYCPSQFTQDDYTAITIYAIKFVQHNILLHLINSNKFDYKCVTTKLIQTVLYTITDTHDVVEVVDLLYTICKDLRVTVKMLVHAHTKNIQLFYTLLKYASDEIIQLYSNDSCNDSV